MIPFKGCLTFKQYMKIKLIKWGTKVFILSDATNGYVYRLQIPPGKNFELANVDVGFARGYHYNLCQILIGITYTRDVPSDENR